MIVSVAGCNVHNLVTSLSAFNLMNTKKFPNFISSDNFNMYYSILYELQRNKFTEDNDTVYYHDFDLGDDGENKNFNDYYFDGNFKCLFDLVIQKDYIDLSCDKHDIFFLSGEESCSVFFKKEKFNLFFNDNVEKDITEQYFVVEGTHSSDKNIEEKINWLISLKVKEYMDFHKESK